MHDSLENYYKTNFLLMQEHHYSLTELENMMPWEREVYVTFLIEHLNKKSEKAKERARQNRGIV